MSAFTTLTTFIQRKEIRIMSSEVAVVYEAAEENGDSKKYLGATGIVLRCNPSMVIYVREKPETVSSLISKNL